MDREKVIRGLEFCIADEYCDDCPYTDDCFELDDKPDGEKLMRDALELLKAQPQIVRCEECKHRNKQSCGIWTNGVYNPDWFCADGERKVDNA